jgi:lysyl-tRNA synthetase class 2
MASIEELRDARIKKIELLKEAGMDPYTANSLRTHTIREAIDGFDMISSINKEITLAGRVMSLRGQGALVFFNLTDGSDKFQGFLKKGEIDDNLFKLFIDTVDIADFVEVTGTLFKTKTEQQTILVKNWRILTKSLQPLPEKWHGLQDIEEKFRKRYLDILTTDELKDLFIKKAKFWEATRNFMKEHGFLEVETPTLEVTTGSQSI